MPQLSRASARRSADRAGRARRARAGFTLVEMVIAIVLLAIVGGALLVLFTSQQRFYRDASQTTAVQRELRSGSSVLPLDLRGASSVGQDLQAISTTSITFNAPIGSGVICAKPDAQTIDVLPPGLSQHTLTSWWTIPAVGDTVFVFDDSASAGAQDDVWRKYAIASFTTNNLACATTPLANAVTDAPALKPRYRLRVAGTATLGTAVASGGVVRFTRPMRYELFQPAGSTDWYLGSQQYQGGSWQALIALSGPYRAPADNGLVLTYWDSAGTSVAVGANAARRAQISRVDVALRARSEFATARSRGAAFARDSLLFRVGIRNYR